MKADYYLVLPGISEKKYWSANGRVLKGVLE